MERPINRKNTISAAVFWAFFSYSFCQADVGPFATSSPPPPGPPNPFAPVDINGKKIQADTPPAFAFPSPPPTPLNQPLEYEKCYGVSGKDENDCGYSSFDGDVNECAGTSNPCNPGAWRWVPKGVCERIVVGTRRDGTILNGTLQATRERGYPVVCTPYNPALFQSKNYGL